MRRLVLGVSALGLLAAGCGGSGGNGGLSVTIAPAKTYELGGFQPTAPITPGKPVKVSFRIQLPSGKTLTAYNRGSGPHTGVHLIAVRDDLSILIHQHPPVGADGVLSTEVTFPKPGRYVVRLTVSDQQGATSKAAQAVVVGPALAPAPAAPPAFRPAAPSSR